MNALDNAIGAKLIGDTVSGGVNHTDTGATGGIHQLIAPENATLPRVHYQELLDTALYSYQTLVGDHCYYQVTVFAVTTPTEAGAVRAGRLAERARLILTDPSMSVSGKTLLYSRFERSIPARAETDGTRIIYSKGFILEVWLA